MILAFLPGCACAQEAVQRTKVREQLGIEGSVAKDWAKSCFCHCCGFAQQDMEVKKWQEKQVVALQPGASGEAMQYQAPV